jgi:predicted ATPase
MIVNSLRVNPTRIKPESWPFTLPCVAQLLRTGLEFTAPITILVGENGSGKSTLIEAVAEAHGIDVRGGHGARRYASSLPKGPLGEAIELRYSSISRRAKPSSGFFLRAETAFEMLNAMSDYGLSGYGDRHAGTVSHGESYLQVLEGRFGELGLYLLDEPDSPLSFESCLRLMRILRDVVSRGSQVICATHSPLLAALPNAQILEIGAAGITPADWSGLQMVEHWRRYMENPDAYLRDLLS